MFAISGHLSGTGTIGGTRRAGRAGERFPRLRRKASETSSAQNGERQLTGGGADGLAAGQPMIVVLTSDATLVR